MPSFHYQIEIENIDLTLLGRLMHWISNYIWRIANERKTLKFHLNNLFFPSDQQQNAANSVKK